MSKHHLADRLPRRRARIGLAAVVLALVAIPAADAHGLGGITDLPVPGWLFLVGGATVLVVSFVLLGTLWQTPRLQARDSGRPVPRPVSSVLLSPVLSIALRTLTGAFFVLVWLAAIFGSTHVSQNLAPTTVFVIFWVGIAVLSAIAGDVWSVLDPWRAIADLVAAVGRRLGVAPRVRPYPSRFGVWPAVALLFAFVALELVKLEPAAPRTLAVAILIYSVATWTGMALYGRAGWTRSGDGFAVYFNLLSRLSLLGTRKGPGRREVVLRRPLSALTEIDRRPGIVAFVSVMLGSVAFDGFSRSTWWQNILFDLTDHTTSEQSADRLTMAVNLAVLLLAIFIVAAAFLTAVRVAEKMAGRGVRFKGVFVGSLVPIAFAYVLAHYLTFLVIQGQFVVPLLSDPFGKGWDVIGTAGFQPNLSVLSPNTTWYIQVFVLVAGHVAGLVVAHDQAIALTRSHEIAVRTQYAMLALMILYTVGGMWLLSLT